MARRFRNAAPLDTRDDASMPVTPALAVHDGAVETAERAAVGTRPSGRLTVPDLFVALAVAGAAAWLRRRQLGPPSLWLDDAWPALVTRVGWAHVPDVGLTAPGFAAILKAWLHVTGFSATKAQSVAFTFGVLGPALVWLLCVARGLGRPAAALATATIVTSPASVVYSARVKQYTLDAVLVIVLLWLGWRLIEATHEKRRWIAFTIAAIVATAISSTVVPVVCGGYLGALLAGWPTGRSIAAQEAKHLGAYTLFGAAWWLAMLHPRLGPGLHQYWHAFYFRINDPVALAQSVAHTPARFDGGFVDIPNVLVVVLVVAAAVVCWKTRRALAVLLITPLAGAVVLAFAQLAPLGTGRTDLYLYPVVATLLAVGASAFVRQAKLPGLLLVVVLIAAMAVSAKAPSDYPRENMRRAVRTLVRHARPGDTIMVYYGGKYSFALYAPWSVSVHSTTRETNGFDVRIHRAHIIQLPAYSDRSLYLATVTRLSASVDRLWLIGAHGHLDVVVIERALVKAGFNKHRRYYGGLSAFLSFWGRS